MDVAIFNLHCRVILSEDHCQDFENQGRILLNGKQFLPCEIGWNYYDLLMENTSSQSLLHAYRLKAVDLNPPILEGWVNFYGDIACLLDWFQHGMVEVNVSKADTVIYSTYAPIRTSFDILWLVVTRIPVIDLEKANDLLPKVVEALADLGLA